MKFLISLASLLFVAIYAQEDSNVEKYLGQLDTAYKNAQDNITTYSQEVYKRINTVKQDLSLFSTTDQKRLVSQLAVVEKMLPGAVTTARKDLEDTYNKYKDELKKSNEPEKILPSALRTLTPISFGLKQQIEPQMKNVERTYNVLRASQTYQKKRAYQEQMRQFYQEIAPLLPEITQVRKAAQKIIRQYGQTQLIAMNDIERLTKQFETLIDKLIMPYKKQNIVVKFTQRTNYVTLTFKHLINFYLDDIATTLRIGQRMYREMTIKKEDKTSYYKFFYELIQRIQGIGKGSPLQSKGYNGEIAALAEKYFPEQKKDITTYFTQQKQIMSIDDFGNALWDLSVSVTDPGSQDIVYATGIYNEILDQLTVVEETKAQQPGQKANGYMAGVYLNRAQAHLKKMIPNKDTTNLLTIVIGSYEKASSFFEKANNNSKDATLYQNLALNLKRGQSNKKQAQQAEKNNDVADAIDAYKLAFKYFTVGGDAIDAAVMHDKMNELQAKYTTKQGQAELNNFVTKYKKQLQSYMLSISVPTIDQSTQLLHYDAMLSDLGLACKEAIKKYELAIASLETLSKPTKDLEDAVRTLQFIVDGLNHLNTGDSFAQVGDLENLENAEYNAYPQALFNARNADELYSATLKDYVSIYPALFASDQLNKFLKKEQTWNFELLFNRHCAKMYCEALAKITNDESLIVQYLSAADGTRIIYLSDAMELSLSNSLETMITDSQLFQTLRQEALDKQTATLQLPAQAWQQNKDIKHFYASSADSAWKEVLKRFATLYRFGKDPNTVRKDFLNAVAVYAKKYQAQVPEEFYPSIGTAIIYFRQYVLYMLENQTTNVQGTLEEIKKLSQAFFDTVQKLVKEVDTPDLISSATDNQLKIVEWQKRFDQAVADQNAIIAQLAPKTNPKTLQLFIRSIDESTGNIICKMQPPAQQTAQTIMLTNPEIKLADIYKKIGDATYKAENYKDAYAAYKHAMKYYRSAGNLDKVNDIKPIYGKAYTRSIYHARLELIVPNKTYQHSIKKVHVANTSVPHHYELYNALQEIPQDKIPLPSNLVEMANDKSQQGVQDIQNLLQGYAYLVFLYTSLDDAGFDYAKVVSGTKLRSIREIQGEFSQSDVVLIIDIIQSANYYLAKLKKRIQDKQSTIHLLQENNKFILAISYLPVLAAIPFTSNQYMTQKPYKTYFPVDAYFSFVRSLSDPDQQIVNYGSYSFTSGNEQAVYNQTLIDLGISNLVAAGSYQRRLEYLLKGGSVDDVDPTMGYAEMITLTGAQQMVTHVKKIKKDDFSTTLAPYQDVISLIEGYGSSNGVVAAYLNDAYGYYQKAKNTAQLKNIASALSKHYLYVADMLQNFLIGDPNGYFQGKGTSFSGLIVDIQHIYQLASAYDKILFDQVEGKIAQMYQNAGDLLAAKKHYFRTLPFYQFAVSSFFAMSKPDIQKFNQAALKLLAMYFKGSMEQLLTFRQAMIKPITMPSGGTLSLEDMIEKSETEGKTAEEPYKKLHDSLLDATIYFGNCSAWAPHFINPKDTTHKDKSDTAASDSIIQSGKDFLESYTQKHGISFKKTSSVIELVKRPDFVSLMQGAFDEFSQKIQKATSDQERYIGYAAISQLTNILYLALGTLYMHYFLSAAAPDQRLYKWTSAIEGEQENILAPPEQWLGKQ